MEVNISISEVLTTQKTYVEKLFESHQTSNYNSSPSPMVEELNLLLKGADFILKLIDVTTYKKFIRSIQWLASQTRPDIIHKISKLSQYNVKSIEKYYMAVIHLLRYLKGPKDRDMRYTNRNLILFSYSDSSWVDDLFERKSTAS